MARKKAQALPQPEPENITVYGEIVQETEEAILVDCGADEPVWLPKGQIEYDGERGDSDVEITVPEWLAEQEGLHDGQRKEAPRAEPEGEDAEQQEPVAAAGTEQPHACRFKADVTEITDGRITLSVAGPKGKDRAFTFHKDNLRFEGDDIVDLQEGYKGIEFLIAWDIAEESGLARHLKVEAPASVDAAQEPPAETAPAAAEDVEEETPQAMPYKQKLRTETVRAVVELTPEELNECARRVTEALARRTQYKEQASHYSSKSKEAEKEAYKASAVFDAGEEERAIDCDVIGDFNTMQLVYVESEWPHREIQRRPMTDKDRQLLLPMDAPKQPEPEAAAARPVEPETAEASAEQEEPETVTLYGEILEQRENETVFRVHYGDDASTVTEFTIPNDQIQMPAFGDPNSTKDMITLTRAYTLEAEIIAAPEEEAPTTEEGVDFDALDEGERSCSACVHRDVDGDTSCADCGDDLINFAPVPPATPQGQPEGIGAVQ